MACGPKAPQMLDLAGTDGIFLHYAQQSNPLFEFAVFFFRLVLVYVREAYAMGLSEPSSNWWERTAPIP